MNQIEEILTHEPTGYCLTGYRKAGTVLPDTAQLIPVLAVIRFAHRPMLYLMREDAQKLMTAPDWHYVSELLQDFLRNRPRDEQAIYSELCHLSVGPLQTIRAGANLSHAPDLLEQIRPFTAINAGDFPE